MPRPSFRRPAGGVALACLLLGALPLRADYQDLIDFFAALYASGDAAIFPVQNRTQDDIESAFAPRQQTSTGNYDWHRGIDIDGTDMVDGILAPLDGYFYDYRYTSSGGNIVILEHHFSDFGVSSIDYQGKTLTKFYTWHLHLWDDGIAANATSTDDLISGYSVNDPISRGTQIGVLSNSGSSGGDAYAPHLHFELRIGTNSSLEYQLDNPGSTQWGFDPHMNPLLLFDPGDTIQSLSLASGTIGVDDLTFDYVISDDDTPILNTITAVIRDIETQALITSHTLDLNQRTGFDASDLTTLDTQVTSVPYLEPLESPFGASDWSTQIVVPHAWLSSYTDQGYELVLTTADLWGNEVSTITTLSAVPEPATVATCLGLAALGWTLRRRRTQGAAA